MYTVYYLFIIKKYSIYYIYIKNIIDDIFNRSDLILLNIEKYVTCFDMILK